MHALATPSHIHGTSSPRSSPTSPTKLTCIISATENLTVFPPFDSHNKSTTDTKHDSPLEFEFDNTESDAGDMAGSPYIKSEPNDFNFDPNQFMQYNHSQHQPQHSGAMNINPANLNNGGGMSQSFGQSGMTSSFHMGNSGIADDELADLQFDTGNQQSSNFDFNQGMQNFLNQQQMSQQSTSLFSHTPDGAPIQSPFENSFNFNQFRPMGQQQFAGAHSMPQQAGSARSHMQNVDRKISDARSPASPNTPGMNNLQIADDFSHPGMQQIRHQRQQMSMGGNGWDSTPSGHSWNESSPFPSPANGQQMHHAQISEVLKNNGHHHKVASSLPTKMENGGSGMQSQEAKRRRRRESHNAVERRRRDNINERIHDLGTLVPQHRLEDEKVRKHLQTNAPLSPSIANATGMSPPSAPPAATSLLAGGHGRRATSGNITQGLPMEDKDKGPNKGDILNGSVAWMRDIMWYMHLKLRQEQELKDLVQRLGHVWPYEQSEDEKRMHTEICEILNKHAAMGGFTGYTRAPGSGLRVPGHTNINGDPVSGESLPNSNGFSSNSQAVSPGFQSGGSGMSSGQMSHQPQFWHGDFKEEDEYAME
ncbi:hypothetical protein KC340_g9339 [Hortaea werneckii]|nr:hypothetical protein KC339_g11416 [Hortaea werneckii]KAI7207918.1 hypothetical protein KC365_g16317 [Hortaea werneckii]KAI7314455.1 hypothetical protein KC340_g9339 [Hortaea werneckii]KAI7360705.1 hypothetical protein KC354_g8642 [Hortaea werneckii]KAI7397190.1 hypothetical protein KC328_g5014 [Hortaea werneckii]